MSRYQRLLDLSTFDENKLNILKSSKILVIGVGGVGQHVSEYLVTNGVENLTIVDFDKVEISNLNRQILLTEEDIGKEKSLVVKKALENRNQNAKIKFLNLKVDETNIDNLIKDFDIIVDAVDNWPTKLIIAKACKKSNQTYLHIGVDGENGQFAIFKNKSLLDIVDDEVTKSPKDGVMGPMVGVISSMATLNLIRYLIGDNKENDVLFSYSSITNIVTKIKL